MMNIISTMLGFMLGTMAQPAVVPLSNMIQQMGFEAIPSTVPSIEYLMQMRYKKLLTEAEYHHYAKKLGYDPTTSEYTFKSAEIQLQARDIVILRRRGELKDKMYKELYERIGYSKETIHALGVSMNYYPNPQDFIRFAVRDVYNETVVSDYGYDEDYPETIDEDVKKAGVDPKWMKYFWRAHWILPSVQQGYEMMHRGEITTEQLDTLLRIADIPKYWREKLIAVSYNPFTRVDVRRMFKLGVLTPEEVFTAYKDIGYNDDKAGKLQDFTMKYGIEEPKTLAESKIKDSFMRGNITSDDANKMLWALGYDVNSANFIFSLWDEDKYWKELETEIDDIKISFLYGDINENELTDKITALALPTEAKNKIVSETLSAKKRMKQLPTRSDVTRWYNAKIINDIKFKEHLKLLGFGEIYIENYLKETKISGAEDFRVPTKADYLAFWKGKIIDTQMWVDGMFSLGYNDIDIIRYSQLYDIDLGDIIDVSKTEVS